MDELFERIRDNDSKQSRFQAFEESLLALNSLNELIRQTLDGVRATFELDAVSLILVDTSHQIRLLLTDGVMRGDEIADDLHLVENPAYLQQMLGVELAGPYLGAYRPEFASAFLPRPIASSEGSIAVLPLIRRNQLLGSLNLVSSDGGRFRPGMATDFQGRLSKILAVCVENTLNFELLRRASLKDMLTGVNNRRFFDQRLDEEINRVLRSGECLSCLFLDIDHFKRINDQFGHQAGDMALVAVAHCIRGQLRNIDVLARYGGEEFVALLEVTSEEGAIEVAERIRGKVETADIKHFNGEPIPVTISIGIATLDPGKVHDRSGSVAIHLIGQADQALYQAKQSGRNRVVSCGLVQDGDSAESPTFKTAPKPRKPKAAAPAESSPQVSFNW